MGNSLAHHIYCTFNDNDALGTIIKFYKPPDYGAGVHEEGAANADYILRYTITVTPPPSPPSASQKQLEPGSMTNQFQSNNTGIFNK